MADSAIVAEMFKYLHSACITTLVPADGAFVFGRADPKIAEMVASLYLEKMTGFVMISNGIGKNSGALTELGIPESVYQATLLRWKY